MTPQPRLGAPFAAIALALAVVASIVGCSSTEQAPSGATSAAPVDTMALARELHEKYVDAINSNDLETLLSVLTEDVVFMAPNGPAVAGKADVRTWLEGYLGAYTIQWDKTTVEFHLAGDWAIERYTYEESDKPKDGGALVTDTGKGLNLYHHDADGQWRVARDAWNTDLPAAK